MDDSQIFRLTEEDHQKISDWFNSKATRDSACQVCGEKKWGALPYAFALDLLKLVPGSASPDQAITSVIVECKNCGNRLLFSTDKVGINVKAYRSKSQNNGKITETKQ